MLDQRRAIEIVDRLDLRALPICPLCHLDLAFAIVNGEPRRRLADSTTSTSRWVWTEVETELRAQLRRASMRGKVWADETLADLDERGARSPIIRELVRRVARSMADEIVGRR